MLSQALKEKFRTKISIARHYIDGSGRQYTPIVTHDATMWLGENAGVLLDEIERLEKEIEELKKS